MSFSNSAQSTLNNNRKLRNAIKDRKFRSAKYEFSVSSAPKLTIDQVSLKRSKEVMRRKDRIMLIVMSLISLLFGIAFYNWLT